ncbi:MAG: hypothetical protein ACRCSP_06150 [Rhodoglobus sp.]
MITRREAALRLDISLEMARRHDLPSRMTEQQCEALRADPPPWLAQSWSNRTGAKPVWVQLSCDICGFTEAARPKKWWPTCTWMSCRHHHPDELPPLGSGLVRYEVEGMGSRFVGIVDEKPHDSAEH